jgi:hypothetical protein
MTLQFRDCEVVFRRFLRKIRDNVEEDCVFVVDGNRIVPRPWAMPQCNISLRAAR